MIENNRISLSSALNRLNVGPIISERASQIRDWIIGKLFFPNDELRPLTRDELELSWRHTLNEMRGPRLKKYTPHHLNNTKPASTYKPFGKEIKELG